MTSPLPAPRSPARRRPLTARDEFAKLTCHIGNDGSCGTHTGDPMTDLTLGGLAEANTGSRIRFTGTTVLKVEDGLITEEIGLDDGVSVLQQLGLIGGIC